MSEADQKSDLNSEILRLKQQIARQLDAARRNERIHNRFQDIELALLSAQDFTEIDNYLQTEFKQSLDLAAVSLVLLDVDNKISSAICPVNGRCEYSSGILITNQLSEMEFLKSLGPSSFLSHYQAAEHQWLFQGIEDEQGSIVVLPFIRREQLIGCLAFFSDDSSRFQSDAGTEFLQRLAAVTTICVENCLNYEQLRRLGLTDALTGLANRRELEKWMNIEISRSLRETSSLSCLYLDVDHFKNVNDSYGHDVGDQVLQKVATVMMNAVRAGDVVARYGGEEFVVILPGISGSVALETAERIRCAVADSNIEIDGQPPLTVYISIGLASFVPMKDSIGDSNVIAEKLLTRADHALMKAKEQGRNRVVVAE
ncbi:MAG: sensor domain-containing diguanylate cyclase [Gammaproteobacteria bacterium]|nr:sensor domain-containing diguanylate cyclase [Gammaproteobacteria bacterium]MCW8922136.1 sensor domain-containing diguanylate cyclase [Gammaproteobacteria bacterium]